MIIMVRLRLSTMTRAPILVLKTYRWCFLSLMRPYVRIRLFAIAWALEKFDKIIQYCLLPLRVYHPLPHRKANNSNLVFLGSNEYFWRTLSHTITPPVILLICSSFFCIAHVVQLLKRNFVKYLLTSFWHFLSEQYRFDSNWFTFGYEIQFWMKTHLICVSVLLATWLKLK